MTTSPRSNSPPARAALYTTIAQSRAACAVAVLLLLAPCSARAAEFDGAQLSGFWAAPFAGLLLSIALCPLLVPSFWHRHFGKVAAGWSLAFLLPFTLLYGANLTVLQVAHTLILEYTPFILVLYALYTIAGGIRITGDLQADPLTNCGFMAVGGLLASIIGTTGAAMLLIRPLLETNRERKHVAHTVIFFIFIVCNCGGCLLPIGDPPLFLGYLQGVSFLWTLSLWKEWAFVCGLLLVTYFLMDKLVFHRRETLSDIARDIAEVRKLEIRGLKVNGPLLIGIVLAVALLDPAKAVPGTTWHPWMYLREIVQLLLVAASLLFGPALPRRENSFNFAAIIEVAALFIGIFICMQPALDILRANGSYLVEHYNMGPPKFYWASGALSSFLDNAPTYLVFF